MTPKQFLHDLQYPPTNEDIELLSAYHRWIGNEHIYSGKNFGKYKYDIIYADPPWQYENEQDNNTSRGGFEYPSMSTSQLCELSVGSIAANDSLLFIWVTMPKLAEVFTVISAWGFKYTTCAFDWIKVNKNDGRLYSGLGSWTAGNNELCLLAKRGSPKRVNKKVKQAHKYPVLDHSVKPDLFRNEIVKLMGDTPKIELFARRKVEKWSSWGNQIP